MEEILNSENNSVRRLRIEAPNESNNFFIQALRGLARRETEISSIEANLSPNDLIIFGTPVWAREAPPAMRSYLKGVTGLFRKKAIIFVTYGSGLGKEHCLDSLERTLKEKGVSVIKRFSLSQFKVNDKQMIEGLIKESIE